eukprot:m.32592 g.32592  ORF g.32592 m.32592 type:complete len:442 (+) comp12162_c0_seq4:51-1376(+)
MIDEVDVYCAKLATSQPIYAVVMYGVWRGAAFMYSLSRSYFGHAIGTVTALGITYRYFFGSGPIEDVRFSTQSLSVITRRAPVDTGTSKQPAHAIAKMQTNEFIAWLKQLECTEAAIDVAEQASLSGADILECFEADGHAFTALEKLTWLGLAGPDAQKLHNAVQANAAESTGAALVEDADADDVAQAIATVAKHVSTEYKKTSSGYGLMLGAPSYLMRSWLAMLAQSLEETETKPLPGLEIGAAYGVATLPALQLGHDIVANDRDQSQLSHHWKGFGPEGSKRLTLLHGVVPAATMALADQSISHVLASNVMHFLTPAELRACLQDLHRIMQPGACLFIEADSPYIAGLGPLATVYGWRRWLGDSFPGSFHFNAVLRWLAPDYFAGVTHYHLLDTNVLLRELKAAGYQPETLDYWSVAQDQDVGNTYHDGREILVAIARA